MNSEEKAKELFNNLKDRSRRKRVGEFLYELQQEPTLFRNSDGEIVGVDAWVRKFDSDKREVRIDPHRIFVNPPLRTHNSEGELVDHPEKAFWDVLVQSIDSAPNPRGWNTKGTVTTVFSAAGDGQVLSSDTTYSIARAGSGSLSANTAATTIQIGQRVPAGNFQCYEGFLSFDTSAITDTDVVTVVTLDMWLTTDSSTTDFTLEARDRDWTAGGLTTADYVAGASLSGLTRVASLATSGIGATGAYKTYTSDASFLTVTNLKTGTVALLIHSSRHSGNNSPAGEENVLFSSADETGTTQDPKLTITHNALATAPPVFQRFPARVWRKR